MSLLFTLTEKPGHWLLFALILLLSGFGAGQVRADSLEAAIMPGKTIQGHADIEGACNNCHLRFDKSAQTGLCMDCHKPVAGDIRSKSGYHGRLKKTECRSCHGEHKGRDAKIVTLDERHFDHRDTDFLLKGKHRGKECDSCHKPGKKFRAAPMECTGCHKKDDKHRGGLGQKCENCHDEESWKEGRFDHGKTKFALRQSHAKVKCADCHPDQRYSDTQRECHACHKKDDNHKGLFGAKCDTCHVESQWKTLIFRHERDTRFPLLEKHRVARCDACHRAPVYREKTPTRCIACHRSDDKHRGSLGDRCEKCHSESNWKGERFSHQRDTQFPLRDKHETAKCAACHKDSGLREKLPTRCFSCHEEDDRRKGHKGRYGEKCESCHNEKSFRQSIFNHDRETNFLLEGKHRKVKCDACHNGTLYRDKMEKSCYSCHKSDDIHFGSYDLRCEKCHVADNWRKIIDPDALKALQAR